MKKDPITKYSVSQIKSLVTKVKALKETMSLLSDEELKAKTNEFKQRLKKGETLDQILVEAFAVIREADFRVLKMLPFDEQIYAGIVIHQGDIAEMKTGEGKSLTSTLPLYLNALSGETVMIVTVNGYLARRDGLDIGRVFLFMDLTVGIGIPEIGKEDFTYEEKKLIYQADIVYTTSDKLGFDYLLENLSTKEEHKFLAPFTYVVIDEVDEILLDQATMPLIISGAPRVQSNLYPLATTFATTLQKEVDYKYDVSKAAVTLTPEGIQKAERFFKIDNFYDPSYFQLNRHVNLAIRAAESFLPHRDYIVIENTMKLISSLSGRILDGNKLQGGLHQAIESKEEVPLSIENRAMASVTYINLFSMFKKVSGMTGTAKGAEQELLDFYQIQVIPVPTVHPVIRVDSPDIVLDTIDEKEALIIEHVKKVHKTGQPILLTTSSVKNSTRFSEYLIRERISHNLLNALSETKEAEMISEAGQIGAVTVATLMAGRGTDIKIIEEVKKLGGLLIIGTEKFPNRRMEIQIKGRAGRLGEPGASCFYTSMQDDLFVKYGAIKQEELQKKRLRTSTKHRLLGRAQKSCEEEARDGMDLSQQYDLSMISQRETIYKERNRIISGEFVDDKQLEAIALRVIDDVLSTRMEQGVDTYLRFIYDYLSFHVPTNYWTIDFHDKNKIKDFLLNEFKESLSKQKIKLKDETLYRSFIHLSMLKAIDMAWIEQVDFLEQLKTVVSGRNIGQHKVEYEYRKEAYFAFEQMKKKVHQETVRLLCLSDFEFNEDNEMVVLFA